MSEEDYRIWKSKFPAFAAPEGSTHVPEMEESKEPAPTEPKKRFRRPKKNK